MMTDRKASLSILCILVCRSYSGKTPTNSVGGDPHWADHSNCNLPMRVKYDHDEGLSWHLTVIHVRIHVSERPRKYSNDFISQYSAWRSDNPGYSHVPGGRQIKARRNLHSACPLSVQSHRCLSLALLRLLFRTWVVKHSCTSGLKEQDIESI